MPSQLSAVSRHPFPLSCPSHKGQLTSSVLRFCMTRSSSCGAAVCALLLAAVPLLGQSPALQSRDPLIAPVPASNAIPEGETFLIRLNDTLDTNKLKVGKKFSAKLAEDLQAPNKATIRRGKKISGHVSSIEQGLHARLLL